MTEAAIAKQMHQLSNAEIEDAVRVIVAESLGKKLDDVQIDSVLMDELGAEPLDFLDIVFRLERNFGIKIPRGELFPENIADPDMVQDGMLTSKGIEELKSRMPYADLSGFAANPDVEKISDLYTVDMLVHYVQSKLAH